MERGEVEGGSGRRAGGRTATAGVGGTRGVAVGGRGGGGGRSLAFDR